MSKVLKCGDLMPGCSFVVEGKDTAEVMAKAEEIATTIAANGPLAVRKIKEAVLRCSGRPLDEGFKIENEIAREVFSSQDAREGPRAFMEKRKPTYTGR